MKRNQTIAWQRKSTPTYLNCTNGKPHLNTTKWIFGLCMPAARFPTPQPNFSHLFPPNIHQACTKCWCLSWKTCGVNLGPLQYPTGPSLVLPSISPLLQPTSVQGKTCQSLLKAVNGITSTWTHPTSTSGFTTFHWGFLGKGKEPESVRYTAAWATSRAAFCLAKASIVSRYQQASQHISKLAEPRWAYDL